MNSYVKVLENYIIDEPATEGLLLALVGAPIALGAAWWIVTGIQIRHAVRKEAKALKKKMKSNSDNYVNYGTMTETLLKKHQSEIISVQYPANSDDLVKLFSRVENLYKQFEKQVHMTYGIERNPKTINLNTDLNQFNTIESQLESLLKNDYSKIKANFGKSGEKKEAQLQNSPPMKILSICGNIIPYTGGDFNDTVLDECLGNDITDEQYKLLTKVTASAKSIQNLLSRWIGVAEDFVDACNFKVKTKK